MEKDASDSTKFLLRLPAGMRMRIERSAREAGRTLTGEIIATLEQHYPSPTTTEEIYNNLAHYIDLYRRGETGDHTDAVRRVLSALGIDPDGIKAKG